MAWVAVAGAAVSIGGKIYSNSRAKKAQKKSDAYMADSLQKQQGVQRGRFTDLESTYNRRNSEDYLDTSAAKTMQKRFNEYAKNTRESIQGQAVAAGATPEAVVAQQKNLGETYNGMLDSLAEKSTAYRTMNQRSFDMQKIGLQDKQDGLSDKGDFVNMNKLNNRITSANNLGNAFESAGAGITNAWAEGAFKKKTA